jgi:3-hydroxyacyl-CoA dehydrogenase
VIVFDPSSEVRAGVRDRVAAADAASLAATPHRKHADSADLVSTADRLVDAVSGASWVQECIPERLELKRALFRDLDPLAGPDAVLASSTSSLPMSSIADGLAGRGRCIVAHPGTPPHMLPVVEVVPAPWTDLAVTERTLRVMREVGQAPVLLAREVPGFVMNRLQGALLGEMFRLIGDGVVTPEGADTIIRDGFGLRWPFVGPLAGIDLNAPGGIKDYLERYGFMFDDLARERGSPDAVVTPDVVARLDADLRARLPLAGQDDRRLGRDRRMAALLALRHAFDADDGGIAK